MHALTIAIAASLTPAISQAALWRPNDIVPTTATVASILAAYRASLGTPPAKDRIERYHLTVGGGVALNATALIRGSDFRIDTTINGATYASGQAGFHRWRRTPAGVVRIIESDIQGDNLDRWPHAILGFDPTYCTAAGETRATAPDWVLACRTPEGLPHWYYVDESTGRIIREVVREGSRIVTFSFDDFRTIDRTTRAGRWHVSGAGGNETGRITGVLAHSIAASEVAIPKSVSTAFVTPNGNSRLPVVFHHMGLDMEVPVNVNGHRLRFTVDTGTTQIIMDVGAAARSGLQSTLGHAIAAQVRVGDAVARNVPIETTDLFGDYFDGILGNEFFLGHIVHIDYQNQVLELLPRYGFTPPANAIELSASYSEGLPLVAARVGRILGNRFALDTGSPGLLLSHAFARRAASAFMRQPVGTFNGLHFLEGYVGIEKDRVHTFAFGPTEFTDQAVEIAKARSNDLELPVDGIIGTEILSQYEWWLDYDGNRLWVRYTPYDAGGFASF